MIQTLAVLAYFFMENAWARNLKSAVDKLNQQVSNLGLACALLGVIIAGIYFVLGKQDASTKVTQALLGTFIITFSAGIVKTITGLA